MTSEMLVNEKLEHRCSSCLPHAIKKFKWFRQMALLGPIPIAMDNPLGKWNVTRGKQICKWGIEVNGGRTDEGRLWTRLQRFPRERSGISSISTQVQPTDHVHRTNIGGANCGEGQRKRQNASERFHQNMLPHCPRINIEKGRAIVALGRTLPPSLSRSIKISIKD